MTVKILHAGTLSVATTRVPRCKRRLRQQMNAQRRRRPLHAVPVRLLRSGVWRRGKRRCGSAAVGSSVFTRLWSHSERLCQQRARAPMPPTIKILYYYNILFLCIIFVKKKNNFDIPTIHTYDKSNQRFSLVGLNSLKNVLIQTINSKSFIKHFIF